MVWGHAAADIRDPIEWKEAMDKGSGYRMTDPFNNGFDETQEPLEARAVPRGWPVLAWIVIVVVVSGWVTLRELAPERDEGGGESRLNKFFVDVQYRLLVGLAEALREQGDKEFERALLPPPRGPVEHRLKHIVTVGELVGPQEALDQIEWLKQDLLTYAPDITEEEQRLLELLRRLYQDYAAGRWTGPSLTNEERVFLRERVGWYGELALAPRGLAVPDAAAGIGGGMAVAVATPPRQEVIAPAYRTFSLIFGGIGMAMFLGLVGLIGLIILLVMAANGSVRSRLACPSERGGIYAETFAVWLLLFGGLNLALGVLDAGRLNLVLAGAPLLLSLVALAWPVQRGIPWRTVRRDIGLTWGDRPLAEPPAGVACYVMALPIVGVGIIIMLVLLSLQRASAAENGNPFDTPGIPSHPVVEPLLFGDWETRLVIVFLAVVVAPLVEEIMFRGVLYRHLRDATCHAPVLSIVISGTVTSFLFAVIHPQPLYAVPVLMALAYGFAIAREWRGTLLPCMVAHGLHNGIMLLMLVSLAAE